MRYIGGKNSPGVVQRIINLMPPHRVYIEPFLGSGAVFRAKLPAEVNIGIDLCPVALAALEEEIKPGVHLLRRCGISFLEEHQWHGDELVYADPPYLLSTRGGRKYYDHELSEADHKKLLRVIKHIPAKVIISGYPSPLYDEALAEWNRITYTAYTRNHKKRTEVLWLNFSPPETLHDARFVGADRRERWNLEKRRRSFRRKFAAMPASHRASIYSALVDVMRESGQLDASGSCAAFPGVTRSRS